MRNLSAHVHDMKQAVLDTLALSKQAAERYATLCISCLFSLGSLELALLLHCSVVTSAGDAPVGPDTALPSLADHIAAESKRQSTAPRVSRLVKQVSALSVESDSREVADWDDEPASSENEEDNKVVEPQITAMDFSVHVAECIVRLHTLSNYQWSLADSRMLDVPLTGSYHRRAPHGSFDGSALPPTVTDANRQTTPVLPAVVELCELCLCDVDVEV